MNQSTFIVIGLAILFALAVGAAFFSFVNRVKPKAAARYPAVHAGRTPPPPCAVPARYWDYLAGRKYPYFFRYEEGGWPETPEWNRGSRPWIVP